MSLDVFPFRSRMDKDVADDDRESDINHLSHRRNGQKEEVLTHSPTGMFPSRFNVERPWIELHLRESKHHYIEEVGNTSCPKNGIEWKCLSDE